MPNPANKKTVAVDIDDVLAIFVTGFIKFSNDKWGTKLKIQDYDEHWAKMWNINHEEVAKRTKQMDIEKLASRLEPVSEAKAVLKKLAEAYKLVITTSRRTTMTDETLEWINKYFPGIFQEVHFAGMWDKLDSDAAINLSVKVTKAELCQQLGADFLIDDHPKHCFAAAAAGIRSVLFGNYPWSQDLELPQGVTRARNWQEVLEYFENDKG